MAVADLGRTEDGVEIRVLPEALSGPAPARVPRDDDHGREVHGTPPDVASAAEVRAYISGAGGSKLGALGSGSGSSSACRGRSPTRSADGIRCGVPSTAT